MTQINEARLESHFKELAKIGKDPTGGWTRKSFTPEYFKACNLVSSWMKDAGMSVRFDAAGNLIGRLEGSQPGSPAVAMGSHIDTVKNGGMFDGTVGVLSGIEVATLIHENNIPHSNPIEVIVFAEEEGSRFDVGFLGSKAVVGIADRDFIFNKRDFNGKLIAETYKEYGFDPEKFNEARRQKGEIKCYFELHIEQSHVLEATKHTLGVVEGIAGYIWLVAKIKGQASHAGATPMDFRHDALIPAAMIIQDAEKIAKSVGERTVVTVGKVRITPGETNVVPGETEFTFDIRDINMKNVEKAAGLISERFYAICKERDIEGEIHESIRTIATSLSDRMISCVEDAVKQTGAPYMRMMSGAAHDAQIMANITDVGMIFVPSINGISHDPNEKTDYRDIALGATALLNAVLRQLES